MSIEGLRVGTTTSATRSPVAAQRVRMSLRFEPITSWSMGTPIRSAIQPEKMLPKLPPRPRPDLVAAERAEVAQRTQRRFLDDVLRILVVVGEPAGEVVGRVQVRQGHGLEAKSFIVHGHAAFSLILAIPTRRPVYSRLGTA